MTLMTEYCFEGFSLLNFASDSVAASIMLGSDKSMGPDTSMEPGQSGHMVLICLRETIDENSFLNSINFQS